MSTERAVKGGPEHERERGERTADRGVDDERVQHERVCLIAAPRAERARDCR